MRVNEVAEELGVSVPYAYKLIREMNEELRKTGCITIAGRIDRKFFKNVHTQLSCIFNHAIKYYGLQVNPAAKAGTMGGEQPKEIDFEKKALRINRHGLHKGCHETLTPYSFRFR